MVNAQKFTREHVVAFAKQYVEAQVDTPEIGYIKVHISDLDPRIEIQPCINPLKANIPEKDLSRNVNVKIYCDDSTPWQMYLPARIRTMIPVVVTNSAINKNTLLDKTNILVTYKDQKRVYGEVNSDIDELIGTKAKRNLPLGASITKRNVCFVCKGDDVTIVAQSSDFMIKTAGVALRDGAIGDKVSVRNKHSNKTITAKVTAINQVVINL